VKSNLDLEFHRPNFSLPRTLSSLKGFAPTTQAPHSFIINDFCLDKKRAVKNILFKFEKKIMISILYNDKVIK